MFPVPTSLSSSRSLALLAKQRILGSVVLRLREAEVNCAQALSLLS